MRLIFFNSILWRWKSKHRDTYLPKFHRFARCQGSYFGHCFLLPVSKLKPVCSSGYLHAEPHPEVSVILFIFFLYIAQEFQGKQENFTEIPPPRPAGWDSRVSRAVFIHPVPIVVLHLRLEPGSRD